MLTRCCFISWAAPFLISSSFPTWFLLEGGRSSNSLPPPPASPCIRGRPGPCFPPQPEPKFLVFLTSYHSHLPLVTLYVASYFYCFNYTFSTAPTSQIHKQICLRKKCTLLNRSLSCKLLYGFTALFLTQGPPPPIHLPVTHTYTNSISRGRADFMKRGFWLKLA